MSQQDKIFHRSLIGLSSSLATKNEASVTEIARPEHADRQIWRDGCRGDRSGIKSVSNLWVPPECALHRPAR